MYIGVRPSPVAHLIELGTGPRFTKSGESRGRMLPQPFMRPAFEATKHQVMKDLADIIREEIEATAKRLARRRARRGL